MADVLAPSAPKTAKSRLYSNPEVAPLDYAHENMESTIKTYHGVSICDSAGVPIGRVQSWQPEAYNRDGVHIFELGHRSWGRPVDFVPGKGSGYTIAVTRAEVWDEEMELAFGFNAKFNDLLDQNRPFVIKEFWFKGPTLKEQWEYKGCWFTSKNIESISSSGEGTTLVNAGIAYVSRRLILSN